MSSRILFDPNQGIGGFMEGGYDSFAYQPSQTNGISQSLIDGPTGLKVRWKVKVPSSLQMCSSVIGRHGEIYFGSLSGTLYCYSSDGENKWTLKLGTELSNLAIGADQRIYVAARINEDEDTCYLYSISPDSTIAWKCELSHMVYQAPILDKERNVYVSTEGRKVCCVNSSGNIQWAFTTKYLLWCSPVITATENILIAEGDLLHCLNMNGQELWQKEMESGMLGTVPIVLSNDLYLTTGLYGANMKLLMHNALGERIWTYPNQADQNYSLWKSPAISKDSTIYITGSEYRIQAIDLMNKSLIWEGRIEGSIIAPPLISNDNQIIVATVGGNIPNSSFKKSISKVTLMNSFGQTVSELYIPGEITNPALGKNNKIYVTVNIPMKNHGYLYCIG